MSTSDSGLKQHKDERYKSVLLRPPSASDEYAACRNGLENVKQMIERRVTHAAAGNNSDVATFEKKQYEILLGQ